MRTYPPMFPTAWTNDSDMMNHAPDGALVAPGETVMMQGATVRDFFAAAAMQGLLAENNSALSGGAWDPNDLAEAAFAHADAMMKRRAK